ncbi:MAG: TolC family protein [Nitrospirota bacterium]
MKELIVSIVIFLTMSGNAMAAEQAVYTLQDAYSAAITSYEGIKISEEGVVQADSRVDQAWTYIYPRLTAYGAYTRYNDTLPPNGGAFLFQPLGQTQASLVLTQPLYTGGRTLAALRAAKTMQESSRSVLTSAKQEIMLGVADAYYAVIKAQRIIEVSKASLGRMERHKKVTEREASTRRTKVNTSSLLRANALVEQARINLIRAEDGLKIARRKLGLLTRLPENSVFAEPSPLTEPQGTVESLMETALKYRDDYTSSKLNTQVAKEYVTITEGGHYPQVYAEAGLRYQDSSPATMMDATTYYGGVRLQIPIFEGGLMKAEVSEARSKQRQAELSAVLFRRNIENEVQEAFINCQTINAVLDTAKRQFEYAKGSFDAVESLFAEGLTTSLSVIDAEQGLFLAERELTAAAMDQQLAILRLQKSLGVLGKKV